MQLTRVVDAYTALGEARAALMALLRTHDATNPKTRKASHAAIEDASLTVTLAEQGVWNAEHGAKAAAPEHVACPECGGDRVIVGGGTPFACPTCEGNGAVAYSARA